MCAGLTSHADFLTCSIAFADNLANIFEVWWTAALIQ
jgi:hypothetical protein